MSNNMLTYEHLGKFSSEDIRANRLRIRDWKRYIADDFDVRNINDIVRPLEKLFPHPKLVIKKNPHLEKIYPYFEGIYEETVTRYIYQAIRSSHSSMHNHGGHLEELIDLYVHLGHHAIDQMDVFREVRNDVIFPAFLQPMAVISDFAFAVGYFLNAYGLDKGKQKLDEVWALIERADSQSAEFKYRSFHRANIIGFFKQLTNLDMAFQNANLYLDIVDKLQSSKYRATSEVFVEIIESIPLNVMVEFNDEYNPVSNYLKLIDSCLTNKKFDILDSILNLENWREVYYNIGNRDLVKAITQEWGGPSALFAQAPEAQLKILGEYTNYQVELKLINDNATEILSSIKSNDILYIFDLGIGDGGKLVQLVKQALSIGYKKVVLGGIDAHDKIIKAARDNLNESLEKEISADQVELRLIADRFEELPQNQRFIEFKKKAMQADYITTFLGTSFCNNLPETSCDFLKNTGASYHLSGIYLRGAGAFQTSYNSENARELSLPFAYLHGLTKEQMGPMEFRSVIKQVNVPINGEQALVDAVVAQFVPRVSTVGLLGQIFDEENPVNCWFSMKYTDNQVRKIFSINNIDVLRGYSAENNVSLYLTKNIGK